MGASRDKKGGATKWKEPFLLFSDWELFLKRNRRRGIRKTEGSTELDLLRVIRSNGPGGPLNMLMQPASQSIYSQLRFRRLKKTKSQRESKGFGDPSSPITQLPICDRAPCHSLFIFTGTTCSSYKSPYGPLSGWYS